MSLEIQSFNSMPPPSQLEVATLISAYTNGQTGEQPIMLPMSIEDITGKLAGSVALIEGEFAGYVGASQPDEWQGSTMTEVGSLWVPQAFRKKGIAHKLVVGITGDLVEQEFLPYAFCNPHSLPIFKDIGFEAVPLDAVPSSALTLCVSCPTKPKEGCCDTIVVYGATAHDTV